jgi:endonuclease/exonuclease/phosphatase family metal-dependent hydrolase
MKLRVATYNIHKGVTGIRGRPRIHDVRMALDAIDADIVFLQEVQDRNERLASSARLSPCRVRSSTFSPPARTRTAPTA